MTAVDYVGLGTGTLIDRALNSRYTDLGFES